MDTTTTSSCAPVAAKDVAPPSMPSRRSLQQWHRGSRCWAGRGQSKRNGRDIGCKLLWNPTFSRFDIRGGSPTATRSSPAALLWVEAKFHHDQALWTANKAQRRADRLAAWMPAECYEAQMERYETHSSSLWHRHRRGKHKASDQRRQQDEVNSTRRSTARGGSRSKLLEFAAGNSTRRSSCKVKRSGRGANSISCAYEQLLAFAMCADQNHQELHEWQQQYVEWKEWQQTRGRRKRTKEQARAQLREQHKQAKVRAKQNDPVRAAVLQAQFVTIKLDSATQQQWDLLVKSRRWGGLLQGLSNLLRPRFAGAAMFALKQAFTLCDSSGITAGAGTVMPAGVDGNLTISAVLAQLLAPIKPKHRSTTAVDLVAGEADSRREQAARLRLGRAVELLFGDVATLTQAQMAYVQNQATRSEPRPEPEPLKAKPEPLENLCHAEWPELVVPGAAAA
jgi:hypothetical protein